MDTILFDLVSGGAVFGQAALALVGAGLLISVGIGWVKKFGASAAGGGGDSFERVQRSEDGWGAAHKSFERHQAKLDGARRMGHRYPGSGSGRRNCRF